MTGNKKKTFLPALTLLLTAPVFGEILSTSSPPAEFFQPATFLILVGLYGSGALLVWAGLLLLCWRIGKREKGQE